MSNRIRFVLRLRRSFEELVYCHLRALKYLLAANEKMVWASQKKILECVLRPFLSRRICVSFLQEENSEWMTPCILQWCRESRKLAYSVVITVHPHA